MLFCSRIARRCLVVVTHLPSAGWLSLLIAVLSCGPLYAYDEAKPPLAPPAVPPVSAPPATVASQLDSDTQRESAPETTASPKCSETCSGFWILSTHNCPQSFDDGCPRFCPAVTRYEPCVGTRRSNLAELCQSLQPGVPVCVVTHGSFVNWDSICSESRSTWSWLNSAACDLPMQMIYLTWPSDRDVTPLVQIDVNLLGRRASRNGYYLAELIQYIPMECPICLLGHSHGTRVVASALHLMAGGKVQGVCHPTSRATGRQIRTVFAASAIDHDWLNPGERYGRALCSTQCLLNLRNRRDAALKVYPLRHLFAARAFGAVGLTSGDKRKLGCWAGKVVDCDVSHVIGHGHLWPYYFSEWSIAWTMRNFVFAPQQSTVAGAADGSSEKSRY